MTGYSKETARKYSERHAGRLVKTHIFEPSFLELIGNVKGSRVLDLGCGDGYYTIRLAERGASDVLGVDMSPEMILLAREKPNVRYIQANASDLPQFGKFDLATASFLLCYAKSREELLGMCKSIRRNLREDGRFYGIVPHPFFPEYDYPQYGISCKLLEDKKDGAKKLLTFCPDSKESFSVHVYQWTAETTEKMLRKAGLRDIQWRHVLPTTQAIQERGFEFWKPHLERPSAIMIEARK